jgi:hypothetical protein
MGLGQRVAPDDSQIGHDGRHAPLATCGGHVPRFGRTVAKDYVKISHAGYRFPPKIIQQAIWTKPRRRSCCLPKPKVVLHDVK